MTARESFDRIPGLPWHEHRESEISDLNRGGVVAFVGWVHANLAASLTDVQMERYDGTASGHTESLVVPYDGSIVAISVIANAARAAGTATFEVFLNGTATGLTADLDATNTQYTFGTQAIGVDSFSAGDRIDVRVTTDSAWSPTTSEVEATVFVHMRV